jgi:predicted  nucleic acid-binding Zn-ribbon protein
MSNADPAEVSMVVSRDGVTVEKSFEPDDFPVPAIAFVIRADRDEVVTVRLSDEVPDAVDAEDIGFHPKYGAEFWSVEEGDIVFEREFEAGEEYTTVYGLRASQTDDVESYMSEPTLEDVEPPLDDAGQVVRDVIGDEDGDGPSSSDIEAAIAAAGADADDGTEAEADDDDEPVEPLKLNDPNAGGDVEPQLEPSTTDSGDDESTADDPVVEEAEPEAAITDVEAGAVPDDPVAAIAQQIRAGQADDDDLAALRRALGGGGDGSRDARIKQLQSELADLRAYTNALEEFLDENGDAQQLIEDVKGSVERVDQQLSSVESRADSAVTRVGAVEGDVDRVDEELDDLASEVTDAHEQIDRVEREVGEFTETVDQVETDVESLYGEVDEVSEELSSVHEEVESVHGEMDDVHDDVAEIEEQVNDVHEEVDDLETDLADVEASLERVDDLDDRLDALEDEFADAREDLQSLSKMREQLSSVFGAQVQGPGDDTDHGEESDADDADEA